MNQLTCHLPGSDKIYGIKIVRKPQKRRKNQELLSDKDAMVTRGSNREERRRKQRKGRTEWDLPGKLPIFTPLITELFIKNRNLWQAEDNSRRR